MIPQTAANIYWALPYTDTVPGISLTSTHLLFTTTQRFYERGDYLGEAKQLGSEGQYQDINPGLSDFQNYS